MLHLSTSLFYSPYNTNRSMQSSLNFNKRLLNNIKNLILHRPVGLQLQKFVCHSCSNSHTSCTPYCCLITVGWVFGAWLNKKYTHISYGARFIFSLSYFSLCNFYSIRILMLLFNLHFLRLVISEREKRRTQVIWRVYLSMHDVRNSIVLIQLSTMIVYFSLFFSLFLFCLCDNKIQINRWQSFYFSFISFEDFHKQEKIHSFALNFIEHWRQKRIWIYIFLRFY